MSDQGHTHESQQCAAREASESPAPVAPGLSIRHHQLEDRHVISLQGELDMATCPRLRRELREAQTRVGKTIVLDLSDLHFIDSSAIRLFLEVTYNPSYGCSAEVLLTRGSEHIQRLLELAGAYERLPFIEDIDGARTRPS